MAAEMFPNVFLSGKFYLTKRQTMWPTLVKTPAFRKVINRGGGGVCGASTVRGPSLLPAARTKQYDCSVRTFVHIKTTIFRYIFQSHPMKHHLLNFPSKQSPCGQSPYHIHPHSPKQVCDIRVLPVNFHFPSLERLKSSHKHCPKNRFR
jgi:hypothetical protein